MVASRPPRADLRAADVPDDPPPREGRAGRREPLPDDLPARGLPAVQLHDGYVPLPLVPAPHRRRWEALGGVAAVVALTGPRGEQQKDLRAGVARDDAALVGLEGDE